MGKIFFTSSEILSTPGPLNIKSHFPKNGMETEKAVNKCYKMKGPTFISLKSDKVIGKNW